jgi:DNA polymerase III psi subunit
MHGRVYYDYRVGIEKAIKSDPRAFLVKKRALATRQLCISKVVKHLALTTSAIFLLILYNDHMLMMYAPKEFWILSVLAIQHKSCVNENQHRFV